VPDSEVEAALARLDEHAHGLGAAAYDLAVLAEEIEALEGEVDGLVAAAWGVGDVPVELLRRPGDAY
jgi:hypothetical protein